MSGYYPPGVTGYEPEIAGYPEVEMEVECGEVDQFISLRQAQATSEKWVMERRSGLAKALAALPQLEADCDFTGVETLQVSGDVGYWTCPWCGKDQEVDLSEDGSGYI